MRAETLHTCKMIMRKAGIWRFSVVLAFFLLSVFPAHAQVMTEVEKLDFGQFGLRDNSAAHTLIVTPNNTATYDAAIIEGGRLPQRGEYDLTGFPPNMTLTLGVAVANPPNDGGLVLDNSGGATFGGKVFTVGDFTTNVVVTDGAGDATVYIGGTLTTSGDGTMYGDGDYNGTYDITFYFE